LKLIFSNNDHADIPLESGRLTIGRDSSNVVVLNSGGVSGFHAEIQIEKESIHIVDLGSTNGTLVNGVRIKGRHQLKVWDAISFDKVAVEIVDSEALRPTIVSKNLADATGDRTQIQPGPNMSATQVVDVPETRLVCVAGPCEGQTFSLKKIRITIGRDVQNDIVLTDPTVSSKHALLARNGQQWTVEDQGSSNGIVVDGKKVSSQVVASNSVLQLGKCSLRFESSQSSKTIVLENGSAQESSPVPQSEPKPRKNQNNEVTTKVSVPSWVYGVVGFVLVLLLAGGYFLIQSTRPDDFKLQGALMWSQTLSQGRSGPTTPAVADINGDGVLDIIMGDSKGFVVALDGMKGLKIFEAATVDSIFASVVTGDLTGDKIADVVIGSRSGEITALNGEGKVLWKSPGEADLGAIMNRPALIDVNGDGVPDVIAPTEKKGLVALDGSRGWIIWHTEAFFPDKVVTSPIVADVNKDGFIDMIAATESGRVVAISAQGEKSWRLWEAVVPEISFASPTLVQSGDAQIVVVATKEKGIFACNASNGRGLWQAPINKSFIASPLAVDADGNGKNDLAVVATNGDIHVLNGVTGDEIWSKSLGVGVFASPALHEFTKDKLMDLVILDESGGIHVVDMARGRVVLEISLPDADGFAASPVLADVNNNQLLDVICAARNGKIIAFEFNRSVIQGAAPWPVFLGNDLHAAR
jgi:pSer/pThr/pTyr-binding forkhead associated (FHA) protein/outer membrane protein assembly factor BamB